MTCDIISRERLERSAEDACTAARLCAAGDPSDWDRDGLLSDLRELREALPSWLARINEAIGGLIEQIEAED